MIFLTQIISGRESRMNFEVLENAIMLITAVIGLFSALFRYIETPKRGWLYIVGFFLGNFLSCYYWATYSLVMGDNPDVSAFVAYLGWNISYVLLLVAVIHMQPAGARRYFNPLMLIPIPLNFYQFTLYIPFGGVLNSAWQGILVTAAACISLQGLLYYLKNRKNGARFPAFNMMVLFFVISEYGMWTSSCYDWPSDIRNPYYYFSVIENICLLLFAWAVDRDYEADEPDHAGKTSVEMRFQVLLQFIVSFVIFLFCACGYYLAVWMKRSMPEGTDNAKANSMIVIALFIISMFIVMLILALMFFISKRQKNVVRETQGNVTFRRGRFNFVFTLLVTLGLMIFVVAYTSRLFYRVAVNGIYESGVDKAASTANELENYLTVARSTLWVTADSVDIMVKNGETQDKIRKYIVDQTTNQKEQFDENFTGIYGYINGEYMDGLNWVPPEDYVPVERDWYKTAVEAGGETVIVSPYVDAQTHSVVITVCKCLGDGKNVIALDVIINHIQDIIENVEINGKGYGMIVNRDGFIIAHPNQEMNGKNFKDIFSGEVLDSLLATGSGRLDSVITNEDCTLFVDCIMEQWYPVIVVPDSELFEEVYFQLAVSIIVYLIIYALLSFFYYLGYKNEQVYGKRMEEMSVSRQKQEYEATMLKLEKQAADEANKAKSSFLADMSHEIRTPINAILGMNEMILREETNKGILEYARNIKTSGRNLLHLINSILDFSKIEDGKMEIVPVRYSVSELVTYLVNSIAERARVKGLELDIKIDPSLPSELYGDDARINQVIMNLLTNAVKYTHKGSVTLDIRGDERKDDGIRLRVSVRDTGIGIKESDMDRLFESFERLDVVKNRNIEGTGLGMSITTRLLSLMGSELKVESKYGEGSEFSFELWQKIEDDTPIGDYKMAVPEDEDIASYRESFHAPKARILIVDDTRLNITVAVSLLKIDTALSGAEAVGQAERTDYDVILMDQRMPGMDGTEALHEIRALGNGRNRETPVICLTADAIRGARERYMSEGFSDYLTKPVEGHALESMLLTYLPKDKIEQGVEVVEEDGGKEDVTDDRLILMLGEAGVDASAALPYFGGDMGIYRSVLSDYAAEAAEKSRLLQEYYENRDWNEYSIYAHSLKSSSKTIGAQELSELARGLENAGKNSDEAVIKRDHAKAVGKYESIVSVITAALGIEVSQDASGAGFEVLEFEPQVDNGTL